MKKIIDAVLPYKGDILFIERTGNVVSIYLTGEVKITKAFNTISTASRKYSQARKELQDIRVR